MRVIEQQRYSSSLEANLTRLEPEVHKKSPFASPLASKKEIKISSVINESKNPFDDTYDESKNPFADESNDASNPFGEDDDYDKNLNPFSWDELEIWNFSFSWNKGSKELIYYAL